MCLSGPLLLLCPPACVSAHPPPVVPQLAGWVCSNSPSSAHETVLEHRVAGDLHVPSMTTQQRGRLMGPGGGGGAGGPRSPSRDVRRRPVLRSSQQPGSVPPSPSPKGMAAGGGQKRGGGAATAVSPSKKGGSDNGEVRCCSGWDRVPLLNWTLLLARPGKQACAERCVDGPPPPRTWLSCMQDLSAAVHLPGLSSASRACPLYARSSQADDLESLDFDARDKPFWKKKTFW